MPVVEFDAIDVDQVSLTDALRVMEESGVDREALKAAVEGTVPDDSRH